MKRDSLVYQSGLLQIRHHSGDHEELTVDIVADVNIGGKLTIMGGSVVTSIAPNPTDGDVLRYIASTGNLETISDTDLRIKANVLEYGVGNDQIRNNSQLDQRYSTGGTEFAAIVAGANETLFPATTGLYEIELTQASTNITIDLAGLGTTKVYELTVLLKQNSGINEVIWTNNIEWSYGIPPALSVQSGAVDSITLLIKNNGQIAGFYNGAW